MEIKLEIPEYDPDSGTTLKWEPGFSIKTHFEEGEFTVSVNREGLISLANHLLNLSQIQVPSGTHIHFDTYNSLEDNSINFIILKK